MTTTQTIRLGAVLAALAVPAHAHHPLGGGTPVTALDGLLSGVGHPMLGLDHLAFILAMGLIAAMIGRALTAPLAFLAASAFGTLLTVAGVALPVVELMVAATATAAGVLVLRGRPVGAGAALAFFAVAGLFHGWAFGEAVVGAEPTPVLAYLAGLAVAQYAIATGAGLVASRVWGRDALNARLAGAALAGVGFVFVFEIAEGMLLGPIA